MQRLDLVATSVLVVEAIGVLQHVDHQRRDGDTRSRGRGTRRLVRELIRDGSDPESLPPVRRR